MTEATCSPSGMKMTDAPASPPATHDAPKSTASRGGFRAGFDVGIGSSESQLAQLPARRLAARVLLPNMGGIVALALAPLIAIGLPWQPWAIATGAWLVNRIGHVVTMGAVRSMPRTVAVGAAGIGMMFRVWIIAAALLLVGADARVGDLQVGLGRRDWALASMVLFLIFFTVDVAVRVLGELRRQATQPPHAAEETAA